MRECFLCERNGSGDPLELHHIFEGNGRRKLSEKYGLVVDLCGNRCHRSGKNAAHRSKETAQMLHEYGQRKFMAEQGAGVEEFMRLFGKNYLEEADL